MNKSVVDSVVTKSCSATIPIVIWVILGLLVLIVIFDLLSTKWFYLKFRDGIKYIYPRPVLWVSISTIVLILIALMFEQDGKNVFANSNIISILSVVGIIGTIIGVILTYEQLKIAEDRIDGYEKLYDEVFDLLKDETSTGFQYYGSTLIPGHIAYGELKEINKYQSEIYSMIVRISDKEKVKIIVPVANLYDESYKPYINKSYKKKKYTQEEVDKKVLEIQAFQKSIIDRQCQVTQVHKKNEIGLIDSFYFSNGKTVIYVVPLHYQVARAEVSESHKTAGDIDPTLIGFKTKNRAIIRSFEQKFVELQNQFRLLENDA